MMLSSKGLVMLRRWTTEKLWLITGKRQRNFWRHFRQKSRLQHFLLCIEIYVNILGYYLEHTFPTKGSKAFSFFYNETLQNLHFVITKTLHKLIRKKKWKTHFRPSRMRNGINLFLRKMLLGYRFVYLHVTSAVHQNPEIWAYSLHWWAY